MKDLVSFDGLRINEERINDETISSNISRSSSHLILQYKVTIPPNSSVVVEVDSKTMKRMLDMEVWASRLPSTGMTIVVNSPPGINVQANANHSQELSISPTQAGRSVTLELAHGIFPFQSIIFWWNGKLTEK